MFPLLVGLLAASQPAQPLSIFGPERTALIFSTVGQSEWCPAGHVSLDLRTGRYAHTATASRRVCNNPQLQRQEEIGTLERGRLEAVRAAYARAETEGLGIEGCSHGSTSEYGDTDEAVIIENGGPRILVLTSGARSQAAPDNFSCWTKAAHSLHRLLQNEFRSPKRP